MAESFAPASGADAFAWEASGDEINSSCSSIYVADILIDRQAREALSEQAAPELIALAEPGVAPARQMEAIGEEASAVEEASNDHLLALAAIPSSMG